MNRKAEISFGKAASTGFFYLCVLLTLFFAGHNETGNMALRLWSVVYCLITAVTLPLMRIIKISDDIRAKTLVVFSVILSVMVGYLTSNVNMSFLFFFVLTIVILPYNSTQYYLIILYGGLLFFCLEGLLSIGGYSLTGLNFIACLAFAGLIICQMICISIVTGNTVRRRHIEEQEQSLDDMLKVVEAKCHDARAATRSKSHFLSNMSHEIRTPINSILGMNELILRESSESTIKKYADNIEVAGEMLLALINEILDFSKIESGRMELVMEDYEPAKMINELIMLVGARVEDKGLTLKLEIDENIPSVLRGDGVRVRQILSNILTNAVKFTKNGTITFRVSGRRVGDRIFMHFEVEDTGSGISEGDIPKLYQAFQRINEKENRNIEGSGLGMSITSQLLEMMGSKLGVKSKVGKGSNFFFTLRQEVVDATPIGVIDGQYHRTVLESREKSILYAPKARVLVVDDNDMNRKVFMQLLKRSGIQIFEATGGEESVEMVAQQHYDLIFMDHMMPGMDGVEALHCIRSTQNCCQDVPIVVLTANAINGAKEMYMKEGFSDFLTKPIMPDRLEYALVEYLPPELLESTPDGQGEAEESPQGELRQVIANLPAVDGLDWNFAEIHFNDPEVLMSSLENFYLMIQKEADALDGFYQMLTFDDNMHQYRVKVHSMKSSAVLVGIFTLGGMAKTLENAAAAEDAETIFAMHEVFLREWLSYKDRMKELFPHLCEVPESERAPFDGAMVLDMLDALKDAAAVLDTDMIDGIAGDLAGMSYPFDISADLDLLRAAAVELDVEAISAVADKLAKATAEAM